MVIADKEKLEDAERLYEAVVALMQTRRFGKACLAEWKAKGGIPLASEQHVISQMIEIEHRLSTVGKAVATITAKKVLR